MFMNDVQKKEEIRNIAIGDLRHLGIKYRPKKTKHVQESKSRKAFKVPLQSLPMQIVTLPSGQQLIVPKLVHELCSYILTKVGTEGLFRKGGSKSRQNEIKLSLDAGCYLGDEHHEIDVASVLKTFFRELPEPLIPYYLHDVFLRCMLLESNQMEAVLLACLLLPCEHLNTLSYFMQFLQRVTEYTTYNKMDAYNLSVVIGPTLMPMDEKIVANTARLSKTCELFKLLIGNAGMIGVLPNDIIERVALTSSCTSLNNEELMSAKKKKKRRSGSLTRMFNGLKKIVSSKIEELPPPSSITPDLLMTPSLTRSAKKRKMENGFSAKKRKEIIHSLPQKTALSTPFTPSRTPICIDPDPKKKITPDTCQKLPENKTDVGKEKKLQWYLRSKTKKKDDETSSVSSRGSGSTKTILERRWSTVSQVASFKRSKKRNSCAATLDHVKSTDSLASTDPLTSPSVQSEDLDATPKKDEEYVRIPKTEYEEIKNRVSAIERRISIELERADAEGGGGGSVGGLNMNNPIENVVNAYEKTLVEAEPLSPTTDQLARRFSRELKIRRSAEQKVFRSPSARKIGSIRRRSRELERQQSVKLHRHQSWHISSNGMQSRASLKRGRPNTSNNGLPKTQVKGNDPVMDCTDPVTPTTTVRRTTRSSSFQDRTTTPSPFNNLTQQSASQCIGNTSRQALSNASSSNSEKWTSAEGFFNKSAGGTFKTPMSSLEGCRSSIAKIRSQNAGMVLAKAKLFDEMLDSDSSNQKSTSSTQPRTRPSVKIGSVRHTDRQNHRIRTLRVEDRRLPKKSMSPRRRTLKSPTNRNQKLQLAKALQEVNNDEIILPLKDANRLPADELGRPSFATPRCNGTLPPIKKTLTVKSPKRLYRTPQKPDTRQTPLKAVPTPRNTNF